MLHLISTHGFIKGCCHGALGTVLFLLLMEHGVKTKRNESDENPGTPKSPDVLQSGPAALTAKPFLSLGL
jgi:hypothetical protein